MCIYIYTHIRMYILYVMIMMIIISFGKCIIYIYHLSYIIYHVSYIIPYTCIYIYIYMCVRTSMEPYHDLFRLPY